jgi:hypothetical protein
LITRNYRLWQTFTSSEPDPIFETQTFRLCKKIHEDAVRFAYGFNDFELRDDFSEFCRLGATALSSIRNLTVTQGGWCAETSVEDGAWAIIRDQCLGLIHLEVVLHSDMLVPAIPYLREFLFNKDGQSCPKVAVDLHVWDRHFSFDTDNRDYLRAQQMIDGTYVSGPLSPKSIPPRERITRLPRHTAHIVLTADVAAGTVRALDDYLASLSSPFLVKSSKNVPMKGHRAAGGRSNRYWYDLAEP